ncbi:hypothetical protein C8Q80DRAFT_1185455 [Daedaleopsis nitida]|nr:hypothetical protein C8Q80DRAFT_1185455 [Daedaleopsis nitida]
MHGASSRQPPPAMRPTHRTRAHALVAVSQDAPESLNLARTTPGAARSRRGKLPQARATARPRIGLSDMPLDILFEIFHWVLHPSALLHLARTSKGLRELLMCPKAAPIWERARESAPAFANLLFSEHCHNCLETGADVKPYWCLFVRYCDACMEMMWVLGA